MEDAHLVSARMIHEFAYCPKRFDLDRFRPEDRGGKSRVEFRDIPRPLPVPSHIGG